MLLTDELVDLLHKFRIDLMLNSRDQGHDAREIGGGAMRFAGDGSPITQAYGLGHRGASVDLVEVEDFYSGRATNWELIVTPFVEPELLAQVAQIGYAPHHFETVMVQPGCALDDPTNPGIRIEEVMGDDLLWARVSDAGWNEQLELAPESGPVAEIMRGTKNTRRYLAYLNGEPAATGSCIIGESVCLMAGASTRPQFRGYGLQRALTARRLQDVGVGCIAQVVTLPGSISHRNAQRMGFQPLYSKMVFMRHAVDNA